MPSVIPQVTKSIKPIPKSVMPSSTLEAFGFMKQNSGSDMSSVLTPDTNTIKPISQSDMACTATMPSVTPRTVASIEQGSSDLPTCPFFHMCGIASKQDYGELTALLKSKPWNDLREATFVRCESRYAVRLAFKSLGSAMAESEATFNVRLLSCKLQLLEIATWP
ncbi:hypothetical protein ACCO45_002310 [Purpureocillium lilacinum]|uniref:Uncharacterized protein n=1 Tax=Purpureocillium lilacinum TaxID=33203 RepID=A0ACC4EBW3_PURLI